MKKKIGLIAVGIISILFAFNVMSMDAGSYESNEYYGGDAYTGIQQASAQAANNVQDLANITKRGFGFILMVMGSTLIVCGVFEGDEVVRFKQSGNTTATESGSSSSNLSSLSGVSPVVSTPAYSIPVDDPVPTETSSNSTLDIGNVNM